MRILICSQEAPFPPKNGLRLQVEALMAQFRQRHDVRLLGFLMPDQDSGASGDPDVRLVPLPIGSTSQKARSLGVSALRRRPHGVDAMAARMRDPLREELVRFDPSVVHVTMGRLAGLGPQLAGRARVLAALDAWYLTREAQVMASSGLRRAMMRREVVRVRHFEATEYRRFDRVVVVSEEDREALSELDPSLAIEVIPNGVDLEAFRPDPAGPRDPHRIVFHGLMRFAPNVTAVEFLARRILPRVRSVDPAAHLQIVGRSPSPAVVALGRLPGVEVTGEVPDVRPYLTAARVYCCPMRSGSGIKNKLLEALACGLPCVVTPLALGGMAPVPGRDLLVGADEEELAGHLLRILQEDAAAEDLGRAGRAYVQAHHSWEAVGRTYERLYADVVSRSTSGTGTA